MSKDISTTGGVDLVVTREATAADILTALENGLQIWVEEAEVSQADVLRRKANATTLAELDAKAELWMPKDNLGTVFTLTSYLGLRNSDEQYRQQGGLGIYAVVAAVNPDGEEGAIGVSNADSIIDIMKSHELGGFPCRVKFEQTSKNTKAGFKPINMVVISRGDF